MEGGQNKFPMNGLDGYLSQPIDTGELPDQTKRWLESEEQP